MIKFSNLNDDVRALVQDPGRLGVIRPFTQSGIMPDADFETLIEMIRLQSGAEKAFIALIGSDLIAYQASAHRDGCSINLKDRRDKIALTCLKEQADWRLANEADAVPSLSIWGEPIMVAGHAIGSLCLIYPAGAEGPQPEQLKRSTLLVASLYEMKRSARAREMEKFDLSRANIRYALALKAARIATWNWSKEDGQVECDERMRDLMGLQDFGAITTKSFLTQLDRDDLRRLKAEIANFDGSEEDFTVEFRARRTGKYLLAIGHMFERDENGQPQQVLGVAIDLTESKRSEAKTRLLLREVNHRVKNMLAILQSLATQTLRNTLSPEHFTRAFSGRLAALATSHSLLSDQEWDDIDLVSLIKTQVKPYASHYTEQVKLDGLPITINADAAIALGLVMHELATNAMQYGALSTRDGRLHIRIDGTRSPSGQPMVTIHWTEQGGPAVSEERRYGFGSVLIEHSLKKIVGSDVSMDYRDSGMEATISMPI